jgi:hypothetical protein
MIIFQFVFASKRNIGDVATGTSLSRNAFAEIIDDHIVEPWPLGGAPSPFSRLHVDAIENLNEIEDPHVQSSFLQQFPGDTGLQGFTELKGTAGDRPLPDQRLTAPPYQQRPAIFDNDAADANDRTVWVFSRHKLNLFLAQPLGLDCVR